MDVRCPSCRKPASEWAARCPSCRADLAGAVPIPAPPPPAPAGPDPAAASWTARRRAPAGPGPAAPFFVARPDPPAAPDPAEASSGRHQTHPWRRWERRRRWTALAAGVVVVAVGVTVGLVAAGGHGGKPAAAPFHPYVDGTGPAAPAGPAGAATIRPVTTGDTFADRLGRQVLFLAEGETTELVGSDGIVLRRLDDPAGPTSDPVALSSTTVVYLSGGRAYAFDTTTETGPVAVGPAQAVFSAGPGWVILVARSGTHLRVTMVGADLKPQYSYDIPGSSHVVAGSAAGLLVESRTRVLSLLGNNDVSTRAVTGPISRLVAFSGDEVAWTSQAGCQLILTSDCPLHLTNVVTGADRLVDVPDAIGFAGIGAFSPDGRALAVYELSGLPQSSSGLDLVVVPTTTGSARHIAILLDAGPVTPTVSWSPTGEWVFFGGSDSFDADDFAPPPPASSATSGTLVPLPLTVRCCMVAF